MPGDAGEFGVLPFHAPLIASLRSGIAKISTIDKELKYFVYGGAARVNSIKVDIITEFAVDLSTLNRNSIIEKIAAIKATASDDNTLEKQDWARQSLTKYEALLQYCE